MRLFQQQQQGLDNGDNEKKGISYPKSFLLNGEGAGGGFVQGPLKFVVCYSGFRAPGPKYEGFYEGGIGHREGGGGVGEEGVGTKVLCVLGQVDGVVDEGRGKELVKVCPGAKVVVHPGGHFVPCQRPWLDAVVGFVRESMVGGVGKGERGGMEQRVEDMEVPF